MKLVAQKTSDIRVVEELNSSINGMNEKLKGLTTTKVIYYNIIVGLVAKLQRDPTIQITD